MTSTQLEIANISATNLTTAESGLFLSITLGSTATVSGLDYSSSTMMLLRGYASSVQLSFDAENITLTRSLLDFSQCYDSEIVDTLISDISTTSTEVINFSSSSLTLIDNLMMSNLSTNAFYAHDSVFAKIKSTIIDLAPKGMHFYRSEVSALQNATILNCGTEDSLYGGAIMLEDSKATIMESNFTKNTAYDGGAIAILCSSYNICETEISSSTLADNTAIERGGAIYYNFKRPLLNNNTYSSNTALYGTNLASYAVRIVIKEKPDEQIWLSNIGSGIKYANDLTLSLVDYDDQLMVLSNTTQIKLSPITNGASLTGIDSAKVTEGDAVFTNIGFVYEPGAQNITFKASTTEIDKEKVSKLNLTTDDTLKVSFRWCKPGEIIDYGTICRTCSAGSYSLEWNSTKCHHCIDNAVCLGGAEIEVHPEYWREDLNSTTIVKCPRPDSCKGGYFPENEHPIECETGYSSYLCTKCNIINGTKYQRVSAYQCNKCPDSVMNGLRVTGVILAACVFLMILIIIMIRKKKENQTSILMRIMTNYIQLLVTAMTFGLSFPTTLTDLFEPISIVGSTSDTFLSFDCFIEDTDLRAFAPSNEIFKVFLTFFCPFLLMIVFAAIWMLLYLINKKRFRNIKRYIIISVICIIFLLHPAITKATLSLFECIKVSEDTLRMRLHMEYECYSSSHVIWIAFIGLPNIVIWVIGAPTLAFYIVFKHRSNLEDGPIRMYFLVLYQGLTKRAFYWEFVNTIRKVLILSIYTILSFISIFYRVTLSILMLIAVLRIQINLKPYKEDINNNLEMKAIIVGTLTLYCGILFEEDGGEHPGFNTMAFILLVFFNSVFFVEWLYFLLLSFKFKSENAKAFMKMFALLLCRKSSENETNSSNSNIESKRYVENEFKTRVRMKKRTVKKRRYRKHIDNYQEEPKLEANKASEFSISDSKRLFLNSTSREEAKRYNEKFVKPTKESVLDKASLDAFQIDIYTSNINNPLSRSTNMLSKMHKCDYPVMDVSSSSDDDFHLFHVQKKS